MLQAQISRLASPFCSREPYKSLQKMGIVDTRIPGVKTPFVVCVVFAAVAIGFAIFGGIWVPVFNAIFHSQVQKNMLITGPVRAFSSE